MKLERKLLAVLVVLLTDDKETFRKAYAIATDNKHVKAGGDIWYYMYYKQEYDKKRYKEKNKKC